MEGENNLIDAGSVELLTSHIEHIPHVFGFAVFGYGVIICEPAAGLAGLDGGELSLP